MAIWPYYLISLVIISSNIPLNLPIALIYHLVPNDSSFWYIKPHLSIVRNWFSYIVLLGSASAAISFIEKRFFRYLTMVLISTHQHFIYWDATFFNSILLGFWSPFITLQLQVDDAVINLFPSQIGGL